MVNLSGVRTGPLVVGERVTLTDPKGRRKSVVLREGAVWHTTKGAVKHDDLIGGPDGVTVRSAGGTEYLALRPLLNEFMVAMPREAAVVYPKDAAQIVMWADIFRGPCRWPCCEPLAHSGSCTPTNADNSSLMSPVRMWRTSLTGNTPRGN